MKYTQSNIFMFYVYSVFFIYIARAIAPSSLWNFADDVVFLLLIFNLFFLLNKKPIFFTISATALIVLILSYFFFGMVNDNPALAPLMYLRYFKNFFIVLLIATIGRNCFDKTMKVVLYALILSVPMSLYQFKTADMSNTSWWDEVGGVLGRDGNSGTLSLLILTYIAFEYFTRVRDGRKLIDYYLILMFPMLLNETKIVIFLMPVVFVIVSAVYGMKTLKNTLLMIPFFVIGLFALNFTYVSFFNYSLFNTIDYDFIEGYFFIDEAFAAQEIDIGRFMRLIYADEYLRNQGLMSLLFGEGLGSTFYGQTSGIEGKAVSEFFVLRLHTGSRNQLYQMIIDFGYIGSVVFILFLLIPWFKIIASNSRTNEDIMALISVPVFMLALGYQPVIESKVITFIMCYSLSAATWNRHKKI